MAVQSSYYNTDGSTRVYPSTKHIATKQHVAVYIKDAVSEVWSLASIELYELINNSIVFDDALETELYSQLEVRVADNADELDDNPSDIMTVAQYIEDIIAVSPHVDEIETIAPHVTNVDIVADNIDDVNTVANDIHNVNILGQAIESGGVSGTGGGGQFVGNSVIKGIQYMAQTTNEDLVIPEGTNAFSLGSLILEDGASIEVPDGSIYKVL